MDCWCTVVTRHPLTVEKNIRVYHIPHQISLGQRIAAQPPPVESPRGVRGALAGHRSFRTLPFRTLLYSLSIAIVKVRIPTACDQPVLVIVNISDSEWMSGSAKAGTTAERQNAR